MVQSDHFIYQVTFCSIVSKNKGIMIVFAAVLAIAVFGLIYCVSTADSADAEYEPFMAGPQPGQDGRGMGPGPMGAGHGPEGPRDMAPPVIIDARDRPDNPEGIIDAYGRAYSEMKEFERQGRPAYVFDDRDMDPELHSLIDHAMNGRIIDDISSVDGDAEIVDVYECSGSCSMEFLQIMYTEAEATGSSYEVILYRMIQNRSSPGSYVSVSENRGFLRISAVYMTADEGSDDEPADQTYLDIATEPTSSESFLRAHAFDGGTLCLL